MMEWPLALDSGYKDICCDWRLFNQYPCSTIEATVEKYLAALR